VRCSLLHGVRLVHLLRWHQMHKERERGVALPQGRAAGVMPAEAVWL
jgi:hypothetical protein